MNPSPPAPRPAPVSGTVLPRTPQAGDAPDGLPSIPRILAVLSAIPDPEIPVVDLGDLGIIRSVAWEGDQLVVKFSPTYCGCPATGVIGLEIEQALSGLGIRNARVERQLSPPWTTDWIGEAAREKLRAFGIAPPTGRAAATARDRAARLAAGPIVVPCPRCGAQRTEQISRFGSTPCKSAWRCLECLEFFDHFKCI